MDVMNEMVSRFLSWKLPASVCADPCVSDANYPHDRHGTNLLTSDEARQMIGHVLGGEWEGELTDEERAKIDAAWETHKAAAPHPSTQERPAEPARGTDVWYRGWEIGWNDQAAKWAGTGWDAYKGGCDLGALRITSSDFSDCLDEIDDYENGE